MNSLPWLIATCFSPDTSRLPLDNLDHVTLIVPLKRLFAADAPLPRNPNHAAFDVHAASPASGTHERPALMPPLIDDRASRCCSRSARSALDDVDRQRVATWRARRSSNSGRAWIPWKIDPVAGCVLADCGSGRAVIGRCTAVAASNRSPHNRTAARARERGRRGRYS